ncbi:MAG TPA: PAS domain-containing sensor histidine kinase [Syntrophorhabdaceae bacterium]|nr:PAS domain-containing sensor histidine kinase [Syntrophorhabdaceae bacterium]
MDAEDLMKELNELRQRLHDLETCEINYRKAEEKYRNIFENAIEGIFQTSPEGRFLSANPSLARIHGYDSPEDLIDSIIDMEHQLYVHPEDRKRLAKILHEKGFVEHFEVEMYRKDRSLHWISINAKAVKDAQNRILYYEGTMLDITQRKLAEQALKESEERYRIAIEHSNDGVAIIHGDIIQYVNRRYVDMFEYDSPNEIIGKPIFIIVHPDDMDMVKGMNLRRRTGEDIPARYEFKGITKTGKTIYIEVSAASITYKGELVYLVYLRDVTERKLAHDALIKSHKELEGLNMAKTKAINHLSHEIKTPLSVIQGNIRILKKRLSKHTILYDFNVIIDALERNLERLFTISRETDAIFNVSKGLETQSPQVIDLFLFIQPLLDKIKGNSKHRDIEFQIEGENDLYIAIDPYVLRDVVEGIVKNAIENTPDGSLIKITVNQQGDRICLGVQDFGVGITKKNQQFIFDGLFHTEETDMYSSKRPYDFGAGGKGLELFRMKIYGQRLGFDISFKSQRCIYIPDDYDVCPGDISRCEFCKTREDCIKSGGTLFIVSFPIHRESEKALKNGL